MTDGAIRYITADLLSVFKLVNSMPRLQCANFLVAWKGKQKKSEHKAKINYFCLQPNKKVGEVELSIDSSGGEPGKGNSAFSLKCRNHLRRIQHSRRSGSATEVRQAVSLSFALLSLQKFGQLA